MYQKYYGLFSADNVKFVNEVIPLIQKKNPYFLDLLLFWDNHLIALEKNQFGHLIVEGVLNSYFKLEDFKYNGLDSIKQSLVITEMNSQLWVNNKSPFQFGCSSQLVKSEDSPTVCLKYFGIKKDLDFISHLYLKRNNYLDLCERAGKFKSILEAGEWAIKSRRTIRTLIYIITYLYYSRTYGIYSSLWASYMYYNVYNFITIAADKFNNSEVLGKNSKLYVKGEAPLIVIQKLYLENNISKWTEDIKGIHYLCFNFMVAQNQEQWNNIVRLSVDFNGHESEYAQELYSLVNEWFLNGSKVSPSDESDRDEI